MPFICLQFSFRCVCLPYLPECPGWRYVSAYIAPALNAHVKNNTMSIAVKGKKDRVFDYKNRLRPLSYFVYDEGTVFSIYTTSRPWRLTGNASPDPMPTNLECPVCQDELSGDERMAVVFHCHHQGHAQCLKQYVMVGKGPLACPLCRAKFNRRDMDKLV
jgi:hypothetical protein